MGKFLHKKTDKPLFLYMWIFECILGLLWRQFMSETGLEPEAWIYASVVVPIVISVSPIGALVSSYLHRQVIASFLYVLDTIAIVSQKNQSPFYQVTDGTRYLYRFIGKVGIKY